MSKRSRSSVDGSASSDQETPMDESASPAKMAELDTVNSASQPVMQCSLPPHPLVSFSSTDAFDIHYAKEHTNRCTSCGRNFPSPHYLSLHIDENHNPVREALAAQGEKTYACFVEDCERKCSTPQKRRMHLIDKHMFPKTYNFRIVDRGIDRMDSMLLSGQRRRLSTNSFFVLRRAVPSNNDSCSTAAPKFSTAQSEESIPDHNASSKLSKQFYGSVKANERSSLSQAPDVDSLEQSMASLKFVPNSVRLPMQRNRTKHQETILDTNLPRPS